MQQLGAQIYMQIEDLNTIQNQLPRRYFSDLGRLYNPIFCFYSKLSPFLFDTCRPNQISIQIWKYPVFLFSCFSFPSLNSFLMSFAVMEAFNRGNKLLFHVDSENIELQAAIIKIYSAMTSLELWAFICIVSVFASLLFYAMILFKDQMIIQENIKQKPFARVRVCCT